MYAVAQALHEMFLVETEVRSPGYADQPMIFPWKVNILEMQVMKSTRSYLIVFSEIQHHDHIFLSQGPQD